MHRAERAIVRVTTVSQTGRSWSFGPFRSRHGATALVESLYAAGTVEVVVPGVYRDKRRNEFADWLFVPLPKTQAAPRRICTLYTGLRRRSLGVVLPERHIGEVHLCICLE